MKPAQRTARKSLLFLPLAAMALSFLPGSGLIAQIKDSNGCWATVRCSGHWTTVWLIIPVYEETCVTTTTCER